MTSLPMNRSAVEQEVSAQRIFQRVVTLAFGLRPVLRKVFLLCDIRGCTIADAAAILGISPAAVTARLTRARREIDRRLELGGEHRPPGTSLQKTGTDPFPLNPVSQQPTSL